MALNTTHILLFIIGALCISQNGVYAFGAGNIPSFAYMEGRAFRHGDIEDVISQIVKRAAGGAIASMLSKGSKFNGLDVKRVYFGNWLRDYSQAVDVTSLKKVQLQTIINLCMALGFLAHGYATHEFEVTPERLGVYLPTEHIDNPKGYADGEDARQYHPALRGPVDPRELEIDPRSGMKNYIANEQGHWDTSKALVRRTLERCIQIGRRNRVSCDKHEEYEAFRLLGQALHTLEDFSAHSNFCELTLISMGHTEVFSHVGDHARIKAPNGKHVAPLVTGTFGSSDFTHSLLGEAGDHLSEASVTDLNAELKRARDKSLAQARGGPGSNSSPADSLKGLLFTLPGGGSDMSRDLDSIERMRDGSSGGKRPEDMSPQELHAALWKILTFRDAIMKKIEITIEKIPGLESLVGKITESISVFVFTALEPFLKPILKVATGALQSSASEVIDNSAQYEVFDDPRASDPTHSFLSKDHFNLLLNEPAGRIAQRVVMYTVKLVTKAWDDNSVNVHQLTEDVLQCLFHPDFHNPQSQLQREMLQSVRDWLSKSPNERSVIQRLTKESVRNHKNVRVEGEGGAPASQGSFAEQEAHQFQNSVLGYIPGGGLLSGNAKAMEGGSSGYPGRQGGYPQGGGQQHGGFPGAPGYPGGPMGGGGHQHGGDLYGSTSTYTPPAAALSHSTTFPMSSGGPPSLPLSHSGPAHHHPPPPGSHTQPGGYTPSFPGGNPFPGRGQGGDGFSFPGSGTTSFPGGDGVSFPGASSFPDGGYNAPTGPPPPHHGGYNPPAGPPPPHGDGGYHAHPGGYPAPFGAPPGFPDSGGYGGTGLEFPDPSARPGYNSERPDGYNPSYQGGGW